MATKRTWSAAEHEAGLARFVNPKLRSRFRALLAMSNPHRHEKLFGLLGHFGGDLDPRFAWPVPSHYLSGERIFGALTKAGAPPTCYIVSEDEGLDGATMDLREALLRIVDEALYAGALVSCVPGKLGFYHDHEWVNEQYFLQRPEGS